MNLPNTLSLELVAPSKYLPRFSTDKGFSSAAITTRELISFFIYWVIFIPIVLYIPMYKLKNAMYPSIIATAAALFGILGWAINYNGGTVGSLVSGVPASSYDKAFLFLQCVSSTAAVWGGSGDRLSDWSRYSKNKWAPYPALFTALPIALTLFAAIGTLTTSAYYNKTGEIVWNPVTMLLTIQSTNYTPACRAATFFAGVALLSNLLYINIVQNTLSFGMDIAGVAPRYLDMKRGSMIVVIVGIACNPWRFLSQALAFTEVFAVFAGKVPPSSFSSSKANSLINSLRYRFSINH
jgi:NCS1 family nucleobase:cation symporter-1